MKRVFINLPVQDLEKSLKFYNAIGFSNYSLFTDENQRCVVWSEHIF
jgi:predicted lactoylglutathione lyase